MSRDRRFATRGLTLLEVLAAVVVIGVTYSVVFFPALSESLQREGENSRRIRASLLADQTLAALESELRNGLVPPSGVEESRVDDFAVEIETTSMLLELPPHSRGAPYGGLPADPNNLLGSPARPGSGALRRVDVRVRWEEGFTERGVERTTFAFDPAGAQAVLQSLLDAAADRAETDDDAELPQ